MHNRNKIAVELLQT